MAASEDTGIPGAHATRGGLEAVAWIALAIPAVAPSMEGTPQGADLDASGLGRPGTASSVLHSKEAQPEDASGQALSSRKRRKPSQPLGAHGR